MIRTINIKEGDGEDLFPDDNDTGWYDSGIEAYAELGCYVP